MGLEAEGRYILNPTGVQGPLRPRLGITFTLLVSQRKWFPKPIPFSLAQSILGFLNSHLKWDNVDDVGVWGLTYGIWHICHMAIWHIVGSTMCPKSGATLSLFSPTLFTFFCTLLFLCRFSFFWNATFHSNTILTNQSSPPYDFHNDSSKMGGLVYTNNDCTFVSVKLVFPDPQGTKKLTGIDAGKLSPFCFNIKITIWNKTSNTDKIIQNEPFNGRHSVPRLPLATGSAWSG